MRFGSANQSFTSMSSAKRWQRATAIGLEDGTLAIFEGNVMPKEEALRRTSHIVTVFKAIERFTQSGDCKVKPSILRLINEGMCELAVTEVDKAAIAHFLDIYGEGKAPSTRNRYISAVSSVLKFCTQRDWIAFNPASLVTKQSEAGNERDWVITVDEEAALRDACDEQDSVLGHIFLMLMATGSRISEITGLRWRDVDLKNKTIRLSSSSTENKQARELIIAGRAWERLEEHSKVRPISDDSLVFPYYTGAEYPATRALREAANSIGFEWFIPHLTRHTWASRVSAMPGMTVQRLCQLAGWSPWQMAQRCAYAMQSDDHDLMAQLAEQYQ